MKIAPLSGNRQFIFELLARARTYHCPISAVYDYDLTDTLSELDRAIAAGRELSLTALILKATALIVARHPRFNHHLFHRWGRQWDVTFDQISCSLVVRRQAPDGEEMLFPILVREPEKRSIEDLHREIKYHKEAALDDLPQVKAFSRVRRMPWLAIKYFSYKARSDPRFYLRYFGTYGLSSVMTHGWGAHSGTGLANTAAGFVPATLSEKPQVRDGVVCVRKMLTMGLVVDHFLLDGADILRAMADLRTLLETPVLCEQAELRS